MEACIMDDMLKQLREINKQIKEYEESIKLSKKALHSLMADGYDSEIDAIYKRIQTKTKQLEQLKETRDCLSRKLSRDYDR